MNIRVENAWKLLALGLLAVVVSYVTWGLYWHERWHDAELYRLRTNQAALVEWVNQQIAIEQARTRAQVDAAKQSPAR